MRLLSTAKASINLESGFWRKDRKAKRQAIGDVVIVDAIVLVMCVVVLVSLVDTYCGNNACSAGVFQTAMLVLLLTLFLGTGIITGRAVSGIKRHHFYMATIPQSVMMTRRDIMSIFEPVEFSFPITRRQMMRRIQVTRGHLWKKRSRLMIQPGSHPAWRAFLDLAETKFSNPEALEEHRFRLLSDVASPGSEE